MIKLANLSHCVVAFVGEKNVSEKAMTGRRSFSRHISELIFSEFQVEFFRCSLVGAKDETFCECSC
jgi:hypothetical protein